MKNKVLILVMSLVLILGVLGTSYSYLKAEKYNSNGIDVTLSEMQVVLLTDMTAVTLQNNEPVEDIEGLNNQATTFQIKNIGAEATNYKVSLIDKDSVASTLSNSAMRYQVKRTNESTGESTTLEIKNLQDDGVIDQGTIDAGVVYTYELVLWVEYGKAVGGTFSKVLYVEGRQKGSLDRSGANYPELTDNMIPVYYDKTSNTAGVWRIADSTNRDSNYKWFDYNDFMWANAVTVKENGTTTRENYLTAAPGTEVSSSDITAMWVWIPRYKYTIFNGNNSVSTEQMINVVFEHGIDKTGTVRCTDKILASTTSSSSETCVDNVNGSIIDGVSTYTHPAFTFGDEELTGFWVSKFEASTDSTCLSTPSTENCNKAGLNIYSKPGVDSISYGDISVYFANFRGMELYNNIHGFPQNETATSIYDASGNLTGEFINDDNNIDTHMIKNMEWGAVAYLSYSRYGKWGNSLYTGINRRVYENNYHSSGIHLTGYSGGEFIGEGATTGVSYNNMTIEATGKGYKGAGASTTGTVYGIYDMNGGRYEKVMGSMVSNTGDFSVNGAILFSVDLNNKYYDKYSHSTESSSRVNSQLRGKLGDGTKEVLKIFGSENGLWGSEKLSMPSIGGETGVDWAWIDRGGVSYNTYAYGIFYSGNNLGSDSYTGTSSRPVLVVSREFPWLEN